MLRRTLLVLALTSLLVARTATADPATEHLDGFIDRVETLAAQIDPDDPALKKQRKLLKKISKKLKKKSASLATDAALAGKIAKLVSKGGEQFADLAGDIATAVGDIADNVDSLVQNVASRAEDLPEGKHRTKALKSVAKIRRILDEVDESDLKAFGKALKKAVLERRKAAKAVNKGEAELEES